MLHRRWYSRVCLRHKSLLIISIDRSPFEHIISVAHCAFCLQWVFNRFGYGLVTYLCSFVKCREAPFGFQTVMQNGVQFLSVYRKLLLAPIFVGLSPGVPVRHAERRCRKLYNICCGCFFLWRVLSEVAAAAVSLAEPVPPPQLPCS